MTNNTIIALAVLENRLMSKKELVDVINKTGDVPFHSFNEWKARGFRGKKGEHGVFKTPLWLSTNYSEEELKKKGKKSNWFYLKTTALFSREQVELAKEERKIPLSEKTIGELAEKGISLKEKKADKKLVKQTSKKSEKKTAVQKTSKTATKVVSTKVEKAEPKLAKEKELTKKLQNVQKNTTTKKTEVGKMSSRIEQGKEIIRIDLEKEDGTNAWIEMTKDFYMNLKKTQKKQLEKMWGLA